MFLYLAAVVSLSSSFNHTLNLCWTVILFYYNNSIPRWRQQMFVFHLKSWDFMQMQIDKNHWAHSRHKSYWKKCSICGCYLVFIINFRRHSKHCVLGLFVFFSRFKSVNIHKSKLSNCAQYLLKRNGKEKNVVKLWLAVSIQSKTTTFIWFHWKMQSNTNENDTKSHHHKKCCHDKKL